MPRRRKQRRSQKSSLSRGLSGAETTEMNNIAAGVVRIPFRQVLQIALSTQAIPLVVNISPAAFGGRLTPLSTQFGSYRFTKLRMSILPHLGGAFNLALGYFPTFLDTTGPSGYAQVLNSAAVTTTLGSGQTTPAFMLMSRRTLMGNAPRWFKCIEGPEPNSLSEQGVVYMGCDVPPGSPTANIVVLVDGVCEFCSPVISGESIHSPPRNLAPMVEVTPSAFSVDDEKKEPPKLTLSLPDWVRIKSALSGTGN